VIEMRVKYNISLNSIVDGVTGFHKNLRFSVDNVIKPLSQSGVGLYRLPIIQGSFSAARKSHEFEYRGL